MVIKTIRKDSELCGRRSSCCVLSYYHGTSMGRLIHRLTKEILIRVQHEIRGVACGKENTKINH
jgi:hypothetical protein